MPIYSVPFWFCWWHLPLWPLIKKVTVISCSRRGFFHAKPIFCMLWLSVHPALLLLNSRISKFTLPTVFMTSSHLIPWSFQLPFSVSGLHTLYPLDPGKRGLDVVSIMWVHTSRDIMHSVLSSVLFWWQCYWPFWVSLPVEIIASGK